MEKRLFGAYPGAVSFRVISRLSYFPIQFHRKKESWVSVTAIPDFRSTPSLVGEGLVDCYEATLP